MEKISIRLYNKHAKGYLEFTNNVMTVYAALKGDEGSCHDAIWRATVVRRNAHDMVMDERDLTLQEKSIEGLSSLLSMVECNHKGGLK